MMSYAGPNGLYIAGEWRSASDGARFTVTDPATRPPRERTEVLRLAFEAMMRHQEELARLIVHENGKPLTGARGEVAYAAEFFRWYSEEAVRAPGELSRSPGGERLPLWRRAAPW
jgi:succinate-semialdehyde dehydrogenase/glutarate-semialdehyde dehydrogenase